MKKGVFICFLIVGNLLCAQDAHFSNWTQNPIHLSPSFAGDFDGKYRFSFQKRGQWASVSVPFNTTSIGFEMPYKDYGLGVQLLFDQAGSSNLSSTQINLNISKGYMGWRFGAQLGFATRQIDYSDLEFIETESVQSLNSNYPDFSLGATKKMVLDSDKKLLSGYSLFHLNSPNRAFLDNEDMLSFRHQIFTVLNWTPIQGWAFQPSLMWMQQSTQAEFQLGGDALFDTGKYFNQDLVLKAGTQFRVGDAIGFSMGAILNNTNIALHYEWNISELLPASNALGAWEFSLIHIISNSPLQRPKFNYCPSFI